MSKAVTKQQKMSKLAKEMTTTITAYLDSYNDESFLERPGKDEVLDTCDDDGGDDDDENIDAHVRGIAWEYVHGNAQNHGHLLDITWHIAL